MTTNNADLILENANVITFERSRPEAEAIAIKGDRIFLVGSSREIGQVKGINTRSINCRRKTIIPGSTMPIATFSPLSASFSAWT